MASTRDSALATTFSWPLMWRMSVVNCEMKSKWLNWRGEHLSLLVEGEGEWLMVREDGEVPGLQHVVEMLHGLVDG